MQVRYGFGLLARATCLASGNLLIRAVEWPIRWAMNLVFLSMMLVLVLHVLSVIAAFISHLLVSFLVGRFARVWLQIQKHPLPMRYGNENALWIALLGVQYIGNGLAYVFDDQFYSLRLQSLHCLLVSLCPYPTPVFHPTNAKTSPFQTFSRII